MSEPVVAIARIPLARSRRRLLLAPLIMLLIGVAAGAAGVFAGGLPGIGLVVGGALIAVLAAYLGLVVMTVRLDIEVSALRLRWFGADRRATLVPGPVTRVPLTGEAAAKLRPRWGAFGWGLGPAKLRGRERIEVVRLARTPAIILIPTEAGRIAVAPRSEEQLIDALSAAARVQQRLDQVTARARELPLDRVVHPPQIEVAPAPAAEPPPPPEPEPARIMTGIERVLLEERLAAERAAAIAAAEAERRRAEEAAAAGAPAAMPAAGSADRPRARTIPRPRVAVSRPDWLRAPRPAVRAPEIRGLPPDRLAEYGIATLPLVLAVGIWAIGTIGGRLDLPEPERVTTALTFALVGPGAALAALAVRAWFPRLLGLVTVASMCGLVLVARAIVV